MTKGGGNRCKQPFSGGKEVEVCDFCLAAAKQISMDAAVVVFITTGLYFDIKWLRMALKTSPSGKDVLLYFNWLWQEFNTAECRSSPQGNDVCQMSPLAPIQSFEPLPPGWIELNIWLVSFKCDRLKFYLVSKIFFFPFNKRTFPLLMCSLCSLPHRYVKYRQRM